jgi:hypothetical protein
MALPMAEVRRVVRETRLARNAHARSVRLSRKEAQRWVQTTGAEVQRWDHHGEWRWTVRLPGFHPVTSDTLERAVRALDATISSWCLSRAERGPTGASLARYRRLRETA